MKFQNLFLVTALFFMPNILYPEDSTEVARKVRKINREMAKLKADRQRLLDEISVINNRIGELENVANRLERPKEPGDDDFVTIKLDGLSAIMRRSRSVASETVVEIPAGSQVRVLGFAAPYWRVEYGGAYGYVLDDFVEYSVSAQKYRTSKGLGKDTFNRRRSTSSASRSTGNGRESRAGCCKTCKSGKACGDSCISKSKTCNKPPGCACNG